MWKTRYTPPARLLRGTPYQVAECYGKPHIRCHYTGNGVNSHKLDEGALCAICGTKATNAHHWPPKGRCQTFTLNGVTMKPALIALCGSGTVGCHGEWHAGRFRALWKWDCDDAAREWWEGGFCGLAPHDPHIYRFGCWELYDLKEGRIWQVRA